MKKILETFLSSVSSCNLPFESEAVMGQEAEISLFVREYDRVT